MMQIEQFLAEVEASDPGLLGQRGVSHEIVDGKVHLLRKDDLADGTEVWIYPNKDGTFTYKRGDEEEHRDNVDDLVGAVYGNAPGEA